MLADFVRAHTRLAPVPFVPELALYQAEEPMALWELTEAGRGEQPPPFWAFAWAGGQALARYVLDTPQLVRGRDVLDLATGSGLVAVAAARAGARSVTANDVDPLALAAAQANAAANGVRLRLVEGDLLQGNRRFEGILSGFSVPSEGPGGGRGTVILAGDVCYSRDMTARVLAFLRRAAACGSLVLVGDPGRAYLPADGLTAEVSYDIPVVEALESVGIRRTTVWRVG